MKQLKVFFFAGLALTISLGAVAINETAQGTDGKSIFLASKCQTCHAMSALGIARLTEAKAGEVVPADLSGVGLKRNADWISKWLMKETDLDGKKHLKKFKGSDDELHTLAVWLGTQKAKAK